MAWAGVLFKKGPTTTAGSLLKKLQERYEAKKLVKGEAQEKKSERELKRDLLRHSIEGVAVDMAKANKVADKVAEGSYHLVMNDLIMLKTLIHHINEITEMNDHLIREKLVGDYAGKIKKEEKDFEGDMRYMKEQLGQGRMYVEELIETARSGKVATILGVKLSGFVDINIVNYLVMRFDIKNAVKNISRVRKNIEDIEGLYNKIKSRKFTEDDIKNLVLAEKKAVKEARKAAEESFKLLKRNCIIVYIILKILRNELTREMEAARNFEIPRKMADADDITKRRILKIMEDNFRAEHEGILQEWQMIKAA
jgi:predicted small secreted protein